MEPRTLPVRDIARSAISDVPAFDAITVARLREAGSMKWRKYPGALAAFVAEMDFGVPTPVADAVSDLMHRGLTGYMPRWMEDDLKAATASWHARRYGWDVDPAQVFPVADVIQAYQFAIERFTGRDSRVVLLTPAYGPFFLIPRLLRKQVVEVAMVREGDTWQVDYAALEAVLREGDLMVLCNPHNPIGTVYTRQQLERIAQVVDRNGARVFADEIHAPIVYPGSTHVPYASVNAVAAGHTITSTSASKAFNLPGLKCAQLITSNPEDQAILDELGMAITHGTSNVGAVANTAAYTRCDQWLTDVMAYLDGNRAVMLESLAHFLPRADCRTPDATYFAWIDLGDAAPATNLQQFFLDEAQVAISDGEAFGNVGDGHVRFNFALPRDVIPEAVASMASAVQQAETT